MNAEITKELILSASKLMNIHPRYGVAEHAVGEVFAGYASNEDISHVMIKASILNALYATSIYDIVTISKHIASLPGVTSSIKNGD
ncbi:unnamed protein product, partial [marine sediment metagenome]